MDMTAIQTMVDSGLVMLIWLVQLIIYPSFLYTEEKEFVSWHGRYTALIGLIVTPLMFLQAGVEVVHIVHDEYRWLRLLIIGVIWIATFHLSVPCHGRLHEEGKNVVIIHRLVKSNWIRTLLWTILFGETVFVSG